MGSTGATPAMSNAYNDASMAREIGARGMQVVTVNGKEIQTNAGDYNYPKWDYAHNTMPRGYEKTVTVSWKESREQAFNKLVEEGYDKLRIFYKSTGLNRFNDTVIAAGYRRK